jgi:DNA-binding NarL/FixJ family response regulator
MSAAPTDPIRVWLIEDQTAFRRTVARTLSASPTLQCTAHFDRCETALGEIGRLPPREHPQVIVLDIGLPGMSGIEGIKAFKQRLPGVQILLFTVFEDEDRVLQAICAGASGYLLKSSSVREIIAAVQEVAAGGASIHSHIARRVLDLLSRFGQPAATPQYGLTETERDILKHLTNGASKKEIAAARDTSFHTVSTHIRNIYEKLHVHSVSAAVSKSLRERLV